MKYALAAAGFINENIEYNKKVLTDTMAQCAGTADAVLFGEAFLQGFYAVNFFEEHDWPIALEITAPEIREIRAAAKKYGVAVSFGFIEKAGESFYSSQLTVDKNGEIADLYRRVSTGWKEKFAGPRYREGMDFHAFSLLDKRVVVALCGDLWDEKNVEKIKSLSPDIVCWPVYTDFCFESWNSSIKYEYAQQAGKIDAPVLYVNSFCLDKAEEYEIAKGGAAVFEKGVIVAELPAGSEGILWTEV